MRRLVTGLWLLASILTSSGKGAVYSFVFSRGCTSSTCSCFPDSRLATLSSLNTVNLRLLRARGGNAHRKNGVLDWAKSTSLMAESTDDTVSIPSKPNLDKYHLIWSPHFWKKLTISLLICYSIGSIQRKFNIQFGMQSLFNNRAASCHTASREKSLFGIVLPLLSSSCCAIQLLINTISGLGCAGFNSYLGPIRPFFLAIFLTSIWTQNIKQNPLWKATSIILAFMPEIVYLWNKLAIRFYGQSEETTDTGLQVVANAKITVNIPNMGCVACVNKIDSAIRNCSFSENITQEKSWLKDEGGMAEVLVQTENREELDKMAAELQQAIGVAGFKCDIINKDMNA